MASYDEGGSTSRIAILAVADQKRAVSSFESGRFSDSTRPDGDLPPEHIFVSPFGVLNKSTPPTQYFFNTNMFILLSCVADVLLLDMIIYL